MLNFGQRSDDVRALQARLNALPNGLPVADLPTTGYFGHQTQAAVRALQELAVKAGIKDAHGKAITVDGIAGPQVEFLLQAEQIQKLVPFAKAAEAADVAVTPAPKVEPKVEAVPVEAEPAPVLQPTKAAKAKASVAFTDPCGIDVANLSPEVKAQANSRGWIMALRPEEEGRSAKGGTKYTGGLYFINVNTGEVKTYAALGGGYKNSDLETNGPTPGSQTDLYKGDTDNSINAIFTGITVEPKHRYGVVIRLAVGPLNNRDGFLIHCAFGGATHGCVGVDGKQAIAAVADDVERYGIKKMVVLGPNAVRLPEPPVIAPPPEPLARMQVAETLPQALSTFAANAMQGITDALSKVRGG